MMSRRENDERLQRIQRRNSIIIKTECIILAILIVAALVRYLPASEETAAVTPDGDTSGSASADIGVRAAAADLQGEATVQVAAEPTQLQEQEPTGFVQSDDWRLLLVNSEYMVPEGYSIEFKELRNGYKVDKRIYPDLQEMFDAARAQGIYPRIYSAYRTAEYQQGLLDEKIAEVEETGITGEAAMKEALMWVAAPNTSEHQLGLAIDITTEGEEETLDDVYEWLESNSWRYGFIRRYPEDKIEITKIGYEPWHFRYVGYEAAKAMYENNQCLEEYLGAV